LMTWEQSRSRNEFHFAERKGIKFNI